MTETRRKILVMETVDEADYFADVALALAFIEEETKGGRGVKGSIKCPACGNQLDYSVANNGHIWGRCKKYGFLSWIE